MDNTTEVRILEAEEKLRRAMLASDVAALDKLLAPELVFTSHLGQILGKQDDLAAHESGLVKVTKLGVSDQRVLVYGDTAVVAVRMHLAGSYAGTPTEGDFRFTRVWSLSDQGEWQVVAGHSSIVA